MSVSNSSFFSASVAARALSASAIALTATLAMVGGASATPHHHAHKAKQPRADLVIRSVDLHATGTCSLLRPAIVGDIVVKNRGDARAKLLAISPLLHVEDARDDGFKDDDVTFNSLAPGEQATFRVRIGIGKNKAGYKGVRTIRIKADPRHKIEEHNERNNTYSVRVHANAHCV